MIPTIGVFARSPDRGRGLARDMAVHWALAECGQDYRIDPLAFADLNAPEHKARQPFGQIPTWKAIARGRRRGCRGWRRVSCAGWTIWRHGWVHAIGWKAISRPAT